MILNLNPNYRNQDQAILKAIKGTAKEDDIYIVTKADEKSHSFKPLNMRGVEYIKRGLWCYLSDPIYFDRCYGRVWLYLHFSNKMPKIKSLKHTINYYKQRIKSPKDAKKYFHININDYFHEKVDSSGRSLGSWYDDLAGDAGKMDRTFIKSKFGQKMNEANH